MERRIWTRLAGQLARAGDWFRVTTLPLGHHIREGDALAIAPSQELER
jgi:hypothetical protein